MMSLASHPESWTEIALGEINQYRSQNVQPKDFPEESFELWSVPIFPTGEPETLLGKEIGSSKQTVELHDVLICKINPRINRVWEVGQKSSERQIASSEWIVVRQPLMEPRYLLRFFQSDQFRTKLCADVTGVGGSLTRAQPKKVATFPVVVPPLAEQKVIADKLDTLLAQVENTKARLERIPQILERFRQSVLAAAVSGRLTEEWRGALVKAYESKPLGKLVAEPLRNGKSVKDGDGQRVLRLSALKVSGIDFLESKTGDWGGIQVARYLVQPGDFLVSRGNGSKDLVGRGGLVGLAAESMAYPDTMIRIRPQTGSLSPEYLAMIWNSQEVRKQIESVARTTAGIWKISQGDLESLQVPLPDITEQTEIVRRVDRLFAHADRVEQQVNNALARVNNLTQSILAKAFRGELTEQWRKDNPELITGKNSAEALLEQIKAERAAMASAKKTLRQTSSA